MPPHLHLIAARPGAAQSLPAPARHRMRAGQSFDARVELALTAMAARAPQGADRLFDLVSGAVYTLALAITRNEAVAEEVAVDAFTEMWVSCANRPPGGGTAWVMDIVCRCARVRLDAATQPRDRGRLRLVPTA